MTEPRQRYDLDLDPTPEELEIDCQLAQNLRNSCFPIDFQEA